MLLDKDPETLMFLIMDFAYPTESIGTTQFQPRRENPNRTLYRLLRPLRIQTYQPRISSPKGFSACHHSTLSIYFKTMIEFSV